MRQDASFFFFFFFFFVGEDHRRTSLALSLLRIHQCVKSRHRRSCLTDSSLVSTLNFSRDTHNTPYTKLTGSGFAKNERVENHPSLDLSFNRKTKYVCCRLSWILHLILQIFGINIRKKKNNRAYQFFSIRPFSARKRTRGGAERVYFFRPARDEIQYTTREARLSCIHSIHESLDLRRSHVSRFAQPGIDPYIISWRAEPMLNATLLLV